MTGLNQDVLALIATAAVALGPAAASGQPNEADDATTLIVIHHADVHSGSRRAARATLARIGEAAMEVCGASPFSLREYKASVRASICWRHAMETALARADDRMLSETYDDDQREHHTP